MLLLDLSGVAYHKIINFYANEQTPDIADVRHALFTELLEYEQQYNTFGRMVICADSKPYWRSAVQPAYKLNRLKARETSTINSEAFYADLAVLKQDIVDRTNYILLEVSGAEADDSIAVLTQYAAEGLNQSVAIISSDKDMLQLQTKFENVFQFSPNRNKLLTLGNTEYDLLSHILKGDVSDGIPNVFSPEGHFMIEGDKPRQRSITKRIVEEVRRHFPSDLKNCECLTDDARLRFQQNRELIDTSFTPAMLINSILKKYKEHNKQNRNHDVEALLSPFSIEEDIEEEQIQVKL